MLFLPIIIPDIAMAIMLLAFFVLVNLQLGLTTIIISHVAFNIAFVAVIVRARMASIDSTLEEAANDLYANEWQAFWRVTFPLLLPSILGGGLFAFTLSPDDYVITFFTFGPGSTTLPVRIYSSVTTSDETEATVDESQDSEEASGDVGGVLNLYNWSYYIEPEIYALFEAELASPLSKITTAAMKTCWQNCRAVPLLMM